MLVNGAATGIIEPADRELLWDSVLRSLASGQQQPFPVPLANGRQIAIRRESVLDGIRLVGVLIRPPHSNRTDPWHPAATQHGDHASLRMV